MRVHLTSAARFSGHRSGGGCDVYFRLDFTELGEVAPREICRSLIGSVPRSLTPFRDALFPHSRKSNWTWERRAAGCVKRLAERSTRKVNCASSLTASERIKFCRNKKQQRDARDGKCTRSRVGRAQSSCYYVIIFFFCRRVSAQEID